MDADAIGRKSFTRVLWGYAPSEVEAFLEDVASAQERHRFQTGTTILGSNAPGDPPSAEAPTGAPNLLASGLLGQGFPAGGGEAPVRGAAIGMMESLRTVLEKQLCLVNAWLATPAHLDVNDRSSDDDDAEGGSEDDESASTGSQLVGDAQNASAGASGCSVRESPQALPGARDLSDLARRLGIAPTIVAPTEGTPP